MEQEVKELKNNIKIVFIVGTLAQGGAERQFLYILDSLLNLNFEITIICLTKNDFYEKEVKNRKVRYINLNSQNKMGRLIEIYKISSSLKPKFIYSMHFYTNIYAGIVGKILKIDSIGSYRNNYTNEVQANGKFLGKLSGNITKYIISNSYEAIENAINDGVRKNKIKYLANVTNISKFEFSPLSYNIGDTIKILSIGRLTKQKRYIFGIKSLFSACSKFQDIKFEYSIYGIGEDFQIISNFISENKISNLVINLCGLTNTPEFIYPQNHIFFLPSSYEGTPNVVIEAMSMGLNIVSSSVPQLSKMFQHLEDKPIYLVDIDDFEDYVSQLYNAFKDVINNITLKPKLARQYSESHFSMDALSINLKTIFNEFGV